MRYYQHLNPVYWGGQSTSSPPPPFTHSARESYHLGNQWSFFDQKFTFEKILKLSGMKLRLLLVLVGLTVGGKNEETRYERRKRKRLDKTPEDKVKKIQSLSQKWCAHFMRKDEHSKFLKY